MMLSDITAAHYRSSQHLDARVALHRRFTPPGRDVWDFVWAHYRNRLRGRVLEVGCGAGDFWTHPAAALTDAVQLILTDRSTGMAAATRTRARAVVTHASIAAADVMALPFEDGAFDVVLAHFMLYHTTDKRAALMEIRRALGAEGWAGIVLTGEGNMTRIREALVRANPGLSVARGDGNVFHADVADPLIRSLYRAVDRHDYAYTMEVTDPDVVIAYAQSLPTIQAANVTPAQWTACREWLFRTVRDQGAFGVTKTCSLFLGRP